jgi:hypothetical protein
MTATVKLTAPSCYAVYHNGILVHVADTMTMAIVWALEAGYEVEVQDA